MTVDILAQLHNNFRSRFCEQPLSRSRFCEQPLSDRATTLLAMFKNTLADTASMSLSDRAATAAPIVTKWIEEFYESEADGTSEGIDTFQCKVIAYLTGMDLIFKDLRWFMLDALGVHPDNREGAGLVPIDVHDLLLRIFLLGWNWAKVDILACEIPPTENGDAWRQFNQTLVDKSDELLAPISVDVLEAMTGRGSHTTALANFMKHATKGIHPELCSNGRVSISKMSESKTIIA